MSAMDSIVDLARQGYRVTLEPSPFGDGLQVEVDGGPLRGRKLLPDAAIDQYRAAGAGHQGGADAVAMALECIIAEFGQLLEREVRSEGGY